MSQVVLERMKKSVDNHMRENQAGFRPGRSCIDQIFAVRQLIEKLNEHQLEALACFIDFRAAFDSVDRDSLWKILFEY